MSQVIVIYLSRTNDELTEDEPLEMVPSSARGTQFRDVTGLFLQVGNYHIQILEGDERAVSFLVDQAADDEREADMRVIYRKYQQRRLFTRYCTCGVNLDRDYTLSRLDIESIRRYVAMVFADGESAAESLLQVIRSLPVLLDIA